MRQILLPVSLGAAMLLLSGCLALIPAAASIATNIGAQTIIGQNMAERQAERCYQLTKRMEAERLNAAQQARERTRVNCWPVCHVLTHKINHQFHTSGWIFFRYYTSAMKDITTIKTMSELSAFSAVFMSTLCTVGANSDKAAVVALSGDLGAGKTTLVQLMARELGVLQVVTSPTFTIMKGYEVSSGTFNRLVHMDAYRIESLDELKPLRLEEILEAPQTLFCIEWAEKIAPVLPPTTIFVDITTNGEERTITVTGLL